VKKILFIFFLFSISTIFSQNFTRQDTLRGSITPQRAWWDLTYYHLDISVNPENQSIEGSNTINYRVLHPNDEIQIDLQDPLKINKVVQDGKELNFRSEGYSHFIKLKKKQKSGQIKSIKVFYEGKPKVAVRPPWDGGITWTKDSNSNHFVASSNQGIGASIWWPNKDHMYDEVDSMLISVNVPKNLTNVSNGRLRSVEDYGETKTFHWFVSNPINNYGVNINIGDYVMFSEIYDGEKGDLDMIYYVLRDNLERAKTQFKDAIKMMQAFEFWFGPYPFYEDSFKIVEVPYLGMEHQSSITYGNKYMKGYLGRDLSRTGWGLKFDYIIIHEAGHEWFANNITYKDIADMWVHESFTTYSENLYLDYHYGKEAASEYVIGTRSSIANRSPIIGKYGVNKRGSDLYSKGANILHTLRQITANDEKWRSILRGLNKEFYHQTVTTKQIENYILNRIGVKIGNDGVVNRFFDQYLRDSRIPVFEYTIDCSDINNNCKMGYEWGNVVENFKMPIEVIIDGKNTFLFADDKMKWLEIDYKNHIYKNTMKSPVKINDNYYVFSRKY
tara:strand:+ start:2978 stop:4651 length:1674 start_codon:yes stop_codon:yes gene_type:complete